MREGGRGSPRGFAAHARRQRSDCEGEFVDTFASGCRGARELAGRSAG
jgi:hypothetical protein